MKEPSEITNESLLDENGKPKDLSLPKGPNGEAPYKALGVFLFRVSDTQSQSQMHGIAGYEIPGLIKQLKKAAKMKEKHENMPDGLEKLMQMFKSKSPQA